MEVDFKEKINSDPDFTGYNYSNKNRQKPRRFFYIFGFLLAAIIIFSTTMLIGGDSRESWFSHIPILGKLFSASDNNLSGEKEGRINILLLGMGGRAHEGGYLTDTIILVSLDPESRKAVLTSIPRDLSIPLESGGWQKINSINAYAEKAGSNGSLATLEAISYVLEIPIQYYIRVDFDGFINIIDELDGITVDVENILNDYEYPVRGQEDNPDYYARYEHLYIDKGVKEMDGEMALKYARSRHALGVEGSDFARSKRQQKIITAVKDKLLDRENLLKPGMLTRIINQLNDHISTNIKIWEGIRLWNLFKDIDKNSIINKGLDDGPGGFLVSSRGADGAYILLPETGNFGEIKTMIRDVFESIPDGSGVPEKLEISSEAATIEIRNGTNIAGLASEVSDRLKLANFTTVKTGNAAKRDFKDAVIYDLTYGGKESALETLKVNTNAVIGLELPDWLVDDIKYNLNQNPNQKRPDFILIVGTNNHQE